MTSAIRAMFATEAKDVTGQSIHPALVTIAPTGTAALVIQGIGTVINNLGQWVGGGTIAGSTGVTGQIGASGSSGASGATGYTGTTGSNGLAGSLGATGASPWLLNGLDAH